ncbi:Fanconi anemia group A protein [Candoia aspera]|uniref:Fanconi anemia group A protein n=1 Tax=Candoia aspera TaxID=51853 RepID=UPI002FD7BB10
MAGRALSALLAGRCKKQKRERKTQQELQEASLHVLSCHQRLDQLLLENGSSEHSKSALSSNFGRNGNEASEQFVGGRNRIRFARDSVWSIVIGRCSFPGFKKLSFLACKLNLFSVYASNWGFLLHCFFSPIPLCYFLLQFWVVYLRSGHSFPLCFTLRCFSSALVSALKDKASVLGMPVGILSARMAANIIEKISLESDQTTLLNAEHRKKLFCLFQSLKELLTDNAFCHSVLAQEVWKMQRPLVLEAAWHLHRENIVRLEELLEKNPDIPALVGWLSSSLCLLCHQMEERPLDTETGQNILTDFAIVLLQNGFAKTFELEKKLETKKISEICCAVLERMLAWVLDAVAKEQDSASPTLKAVKRWLQVYSIMAFQGTVPPGFLQQFFGHLFTQVLTYNPHLKVSDAINLQREWSFARTSSVLATLYRKLFVVFKAEDLTHRLQQVLETSEVNWHHVLSCISTLLVCHSQAEQLVKDLLGCLLRKAFENYDLENMITAFLIVRQAALEGPALFPPYAEWFKLTFGNAGSPHGSSKKTLVFFFKFLSQLVPFEAPQYLKVHLLHPPFVPSKYRLLLLEYITLAKTRLADLKVSIEDMGLYENVSSTKEASQPCCQALQDVEKAIQIFRNTGKVPASVMEASIFRRSYYTSHFLPALLVPRVLPETPDSCMALIESLKRAEKIPPNTYATYIEDCKAAKNKLLREGSAETEARDLTAPLEQLKAELEALRLLVTDTDKHSAIPAQIAVVSEKLMEVLGRVKDEDEAASLTLRVRLDLLAPEVGPADQGAVDLLLASFCQNVMAASYFLPPERQGSWPSLFVKMISGHRPLLSSLLSRLCQLLYHQGPSLSDAHILGLAAFAVHFSEAEPLLPAVDLCSPSVPRAALHTGLPLAELWDYLLVCRSGDSALFCLRFCTAAISYFLCKFPSLSRERLCSLLPPGFVKKLQHVVPRLCSEARGTGCEGDTAAFPWKMLSSATLCYRKAALSLWRQTRFKELLQEKAFQLTLPEWLSMELEVLPDQDTLSARERQGFHHWALYQHYLPRPVAAGGCDGNLREMGTVLANAILDFFQRAESEACGLLKNPERPTTHARGSPDVYCRFQELVLELELERRRALPGASDREAHFLFQVFRERLKALGDGSALRDRLLRQQELLSQTRILLGLPPSVLVATRKKGGKVAVACEDFFSFVNTELRNSCSRGCSLPYDITAHFFRGLLSTGLECNNPAQEVTAALSSCQAGCPILLCSAARWWQRLEFVLCSQWERLFGVPLAQGLQSLKDLQSSFNSFLSSEATSLPSNLTWVSATFLHFALQQQVEPEKRGDVLKRLGPKAEQFLVYVFFFSVTDFISAKVAPQEGMDVCKALEWSSRVLQCLVEQGAGWPAVFCPAGTGCRLYEALHDTVPDQHLKMLPVAFYSLLFASDAEQLIRQQAFLRVAVDMYAQLLQLFTEGTAVAGPSEREQPLHVGSLEDSLTLIKQARQLLLCVIPLCPPETFSSLQEMLSLCGVLDPELKAALVSAGGDLLEEELPLF